MRMRWETHSCGILTTTIASVLWGTVFVAIGVGLRYANPYNLVFLRFLAASLFVIAVAFFRRELRIGRELQNGPTWLLGALYALGFLLQYIGQDLTNASEATLLSNLAPTLVPFVAYAALKEPMSNLQKAAVVVGLSGLLLIATPKLSLSSTNLLGDLLLFGTSVSYALFIVLSKRLNSGSVGSAFAIIVSVTVLLAPVAFLIGGLNPLNLSMEPIGWFSVVYLAIPCTVVTITLYLKGLSSITASESATLLLIQVLTGLFLAALMLGEYLGASTIAGAGAISAAITLSSLRKSRVNLIRQAPTVP